MKVTIDIDCTPKEARQFFGLPDMEPLHNAVMGEMEAKLKENMATMADPEKLMESWFKFGGQSLEHFQKFMTATATPKGSDKK